MYSGRCTQYIANELVELHQGSLVMLDKAVRHRISYTEGGILVNSLVQENCGHRFRVHHGPRVAQCHLPAYRQRGQRLQSAWTTSLSSTLRAMPRLRIWSRVSIQQGLTERLSIGRNRAVELVLSALITKLKALISKSVIDFGNIQAEQAAPIISCINQPYATLSLASVADRSGRNPNYLSNERRRPQVRVSRSCWIDAG